MLAAISKNMSVGPDSVSGEILKLSGEAIMPLSQVIGKKP
jgi:hypothetical protein